MLSIFDQSQKESNHILNINEKDFPEKYRDIVRKLQRAILDDEIQNTMDIEDEIIAELADKERRIGDLIDSINQKDTEISKKDTEISQKDYALNEKDKLIEELKRKLGEK
jgi:predicted RNase H-like nuclease (RuvC/YqgF family)